ncbi:hypothetical protein CDAR_47441 [Caerostris darwini]|uniref:Uncharacterized protein n=1 Tax=Caerostris darwini TaxID=1538125 RepID=A0AAV4MCT0_9ARAC|nr:hypothetical protein CDAR_47441 [Caerostris darwini]
MSSSPFHRRPIDNPSLRIVCELVLPLAKIEAQSLSSTFLFHANEDIQLDSFIKDLLQKIQFLLETVIRREKSRQSTVGNGFLSISPTTHRQPFFLSGSSPTFHFHANEYIQLDSFIKDLLQKIQFLLEAVIRREKSRQSTTVIDVIRERLPLHFTDDPSTTLLSLRIVRELVLPLAKIEAQSLYETEHYT